MIDRKSLCVLSGLALTFLVPLSAQGVKCSEASIQQNCDNKDPVQSGCDVETVVIDKLVLTKRTGQRIGALRLIYSNRCNTMWGRLVSDTGDPFDVSISFLRGNELKIFTTHQNRTGVQTIRTSPMAFSPRTGQAVGFVTLSSGEVVSRSTRSCPVPNSIDPPACSPPTVQD